jgi:hypothetical protein
MSTSPPIRRFLPEPVETSTRSSAKRSAPEGSESQPIWQKSNSPIDVAKSPADQTEATPKGRRFSPQPIEESTGSSRKFKPEPIETTVRSRHRKEAQEAPVSQGPDNTSTVTEDSTANINPTPTRKFAPQPVETTTRSSRRFAPEPVETTQRSRRAPLDEENKGTAAPTKKKWLPEPVETTTIKRHGKRRIIGEEEKEEEEEKKKKEDDADSEHPPNLQPSSQNTSGSKKYSPELLETARGSFKRGQPTQPLTTTPSLLVTEPTQAASHSHNTSDPQESRFSAAALAKRQHQDRPRSYIAPHLSIVESDSSEEDSELPSLSATPSASSDDTLDKLLSRGSQQNDKHPDVRKLSVGSQEKLLREQAMAAYINEKPHEPVEHFAIDLEDEGPPVQRGRLSGSNGIDARTFRRDSAVDLDWHLGEMRKHHSQLDALKKNLKECTAGASRFSAAALASRKARGVKKQNGTRQHGIGLAEMRNAASPPMLGDDLVFPMSVSPKHTRLTPDQVPVPRKTADVQEEAAPGECQLWCANVGVSHQTGEGLWMGMCQKGDEETRSPPTPLRSGIQTPTPEMEDPMGARTPGKSKPHGRFGHGMGYLPLTPPRSTQDIFAESLDKRLNIEQEIEKEFHSGVITQVYNYLSLGYPSLAHKFDAELSKISRIPIEELRRDDELADAKGYVGAPEGQGLDLDGACEGKCARWTALKLYVHEWARQTPAMANKEREDWGVRARRGSWAI